MEFEGVVGVFLGGEAVVLAAMVAHPLTQGLAIEAGGAFEQHVFEQVGQLLFVAVEVLQPHVHDQLRSKGIADVPMMTNDVQTVRQHLRRHLEQFAGDRAVGMNHGCCQCQHQHPPRAHH